MGFRDGTAVVLDPGTPAAAAMQALAWQLRTGRDLAPTFTAGVFMPTPSR